MLSFQKQGIQFCFRNFKWEPYTDGGKLKAEYKVVGHKENKICNDGYCYGAEYYKDKNVIKFGSTAIKINGKKINGVKIPDGIDMTGIIKTAKAEYYKKAEEEQTRIDEKYADKTQKIEISYNTSYGFLFNDYEKSTDGRAIATKLKNEDIKKAVKETLNKNGYQTEEDFDDYTITTRYEIDIAALESIVTEVFEKVENETIEKEKAKKKREDEIFAKARETGTPQLLNRWHEDCNDPKEDCSVDIVYEMAMPDGTTKVKRTHTW